MLQNLRSRAQSEEGFTLIELLVVILIIGILAAIALPTFLSQKDKGNDASAKSNARNLVSHVESCFVDTQSYASCGNTALTNTGLDVPATAGTAPNDGQVSVTATDTDKGYTITAKSKSGKTFIITKTSTGSARSVGGTGSGSW